MATVNTVYCVGEQFFPPESSVYTHTRREGEEKEKAEIAVGNDI